MMTPKGFRIVLYHVQPIVYYLILLLIIVLNFFMC